PQSLLQQQLQQQLQRHLNTRTDSGITHCAMPKQSMLHDFITSKHFGNGNGNGDNDDIQSRANGGHKTMERGYVNEYESKYTQSNTNTIANTIANTNINANANANTNANANINASESETEDTHVLCWTDSHAKKYGVGYLLSNKCVGAYFADSSSMILCPDKTTVFFMESASGTDCHANSRNATERKQIPMQEISVHNCPSYLNKKLTLLLHFRNYLNQKCQDNNDKENQSKKDFVNTQNCFHRDNIVFVRRWMKTKHATVFRFNNKTIHVIFVDDTQLLFLSSSKAIAYTDKNKRKHLMSWNQALNSQSKEFEKRLDYTQKLIQRVSKSQ
ncbi:POLO box duplicated region family protein, partial [Reticulomyxa filosa]